VDRGDLPRRVGAARRGEAGWERARSRARWRSDAGGQREREREIDGGGGGGFVRILFYLGFKRKYFCTKLYRTNATESWKHTIEKKSGPLNSLIHASYGYNMGTDLARKTK
jgi:hypothetical protein